MTDSIVLLQAGHTPRLSPAAGLRPGRHPGGAGGPPAAGGHGFAGPAGAYRPHHRRRRHVSGGLLPAPVLAHPPRLSPGRRWRAPGGRRRGTIHQAGRAGRGPGRQSGRLSVSRQAPGGGTGSLYNQHILARQLDLPWEETYFTRARELVGRLAQFTAPRFSRPRVLMLHASDNRRSNTVAMGKAVCGHLAPFCEIQTISLQNGAIYDCRAAPTPPACTIPAAAPATMVALCPPRCFPPFCKATWCSCCVPTSTTPPVPTFWPSSTG